MCFYHFETAPLCILQGPLGQQNDTAVLRNLPQYGKAILFPEVGGLGVALVNAQLNGGKAGTM